MQFPYSAPCNFYRGEPIGSNRINWISVPRTTPVYDDWTVFWPRIDALDQRTHIYEKSGTTGSGRRYRGLPPRAVGDGTHVHGTATDFLGQSPKAAHWTPAAPAASLCDRLDLQEVLLLGHMRPVAAVLSNMAAGLSLAGSVALGLPGGSVSAAGVLLGGSTSAAAVGSSSSGLLLGAGTVGTPVATAVAGLLIGGVVSEPSPVTGESIGGILFGGSAAAEPVFGGGLLLGGTSAGAIEGGSAGGLLLGGIDEPSPAAGSGSGLLLGGTDEPSAAAGSESGLELAGEEETPEAESTAGGLEMGGS